MKAKRATMVEADAEREARILYLEQLVQKTNSRRILRTRLEGEERRNDELSRSLAREEAWARALERRVAHLEEVVGSALDLADRVVAGEEGRAQQLRDFLNEEIEGREQSRRCPTCRGERDGDQD